MGLHILGEESLFNQQCPGVISGGLNKILNTNSFEEEEVIEENIEIERTSSENENLNQKTSSVTSS